MGGKGTFAAGTSRNPNDVQSLDGTWDVQRLSGLLPPLVGVRKRIEGSRGRTVVGPLKVSFDVVGSELRYSPPLSGVVDVLEPDADGWHGRTLVGGREVGRFRLRRID
jgi:hypothetical protein